MLTDVFVENIGNVDGVTYVQNDQEWRIEAWLVASITDMARQNQTLQTRRQSRKLII